MAIESKNLLTVIKAYARAEKLPLDQTEIWASLEEAQTYLTNPTAYEGQTIKVKQDGKYKTYTLQPSDGSLTLEEVGAVNSSDLKKYVQVVSSLPQSGQEQGVLYINTTDSTGSIYTGSEYKTLFEDVTTKINAAKSELQGNIDTLEDKVDTKAPINNPTFTGKVTLAVDPTTDLEAVTKRYVDGLFSNLVSTAPGIVNSSTPLPSTGYKAGEMYRVSEAGNYAGNQCEIGDLIIVIKDHAEGSASNADFMVVQANIDGAVTGAASSVNLNVAVFDGSTGKVIKDSEVSINDIKSAIANSHTHANKTQLDTFNKTQTELITALTQVWKIVETTLSANTNAEEGLKEGDYVLDNTKKLYKVNASNQYELVGQIPETDISGKADKATTLAGYGIEDAYTKTEVDNLLTPITQNLNTKVDASTVDSKIETAKTDILSDAAEAAATALEERIGGIDEETTIKQYIDNAIGSGGVDTSEAIAQAKSEAIQTSKEYTDSALAIVEF